MVFEANAVYYLNLYLGKYVYGLDAESLKISVWKGDVELRNLTLRPEALQDLDLPITVKAGLLGRLTLKVPWARLGREPVIVEFDRLYILAGPRTEADIPNTKDLDEFVEQAKAAEQAAKAQRVSEAEQAWLQSLAVRAEAAAASQKGDASTAAGAGGGQDAAGAGQAGAVSSRRFPSIQSIIGTVLSNLQLVVTNVHVRYEDEVAWPGHSLALGLLLSRLSSQTVDASGQPAWIGSNIQQLLRKAIMLSQLAVYLDVDRPLCALPRGVPSWAAMSSDQWDALFLPAHHIQASTVLSTAGAAGHRGGAGGLSQGLAGLLPALGSMIQQHDFLVQPVSGSLKYIRRARHTATGEPPPPDSLQQAAQEWRLSLEVVAVCLSADQYAGAQCLAEYMDGLVRAAPHRHLRPRCRPHTGLAARMWWYYCITAIKQQLGRGRFSWAVVKGISEARRRYVPTYSAWLVQGGAPGACPDLASLEQQLEETTIMQFRRMAHTKAGTHLNPRQTQSRTAAGGGAAPRAGGRTWGQWLGITRTAAAGNAGLGTSPGAGLAGEPGDGEGSSAPSTPKAAPPVAELSMTEWARLEELLAQQESVSDVDVSTQSPYQLRTLLTLKCNLLQLQLTSSAATRRFNSVGKDTTPAAAPTAPTTITIACASANQVQLAARLYPTTKAIEVHVQSASVSSPKGDLFHVGGSPATPAAGSAPRSSSKHKPSAACSVSVVQAPQDGHADLVVVAHIAPSFVTWVPEAVAAVTTFFTPHRELELEALQAQAAVQSEALWRLTSLRLQALSDAASRPRLDLTLCAHAPKLALPHPDGHTVLLLDLGRLNLRADRQLAASLPGPEAALYDCMSASLESVAAYLVSCPPGTQFKWPQYSSPTPSQSLDEGQGQEESASLPAAAPETPVAAPPTPPPAEQGKALMDALDGWGMTGPATPTKPAAATTSARDTLPAASTTSSGATAITTAATTTTTAGAVASAFKRVLGTGQAASGMSGGGSLEEPIPSFSEMVGVDVAGGGGAWDLASLLAASSAEGMQLIPVLERFSVEAALHLAMAVHPRYPKVRIHLTCSPLTLHLSPARYHRLMQCCTALASRADDAVAAGREAARQGGPGAGAALPAWLQDPEHQAQVSVREVVSSATSKRPQWHTQRLASVWRGKLYITSCPATSQPLSVTSFWRGSWRLMQAGAGVSSLVGRSHVVILAPPDAVEAAQAQLQAAPAAASPLHTSTSYHAVDKAGGEAGSGGGGDTAGEVTQAQVADKRVQLADALMTQPGVLLLSCEEASAAARLHAALARSRSTMQAVAGLLLSDAAENDQGGQADKDEGQTKEQDQGDMLARMMRHSELVVIKASVPEVVLHLAGRPPPVTCPQQAMNPTPSTSEEGKEAGASRTPNMWEGSLVTPTFEEEAPLITARLQAAVVDVSHNGGRLHVGAAMRGLVVEDPLMSALHPSLALLAHSGDLSSVVLKPAAGPLTCKTTEAGAKSSGIPINLSGTQAAAAGLDQLAPGDADDSCNSDDEFYDAAATWVSPGTSPDRVSSTTLRAGDQAGRSYTSSINSPTAASGPPSGALPELGTRGSRHSASGQLLGKLSGGSATGQLPSRASGGSAAGRPARAPAGPAAAPGKKECAEPLVWISYTSWAEGAENHPGVAQEVVARLSSVTLRTHRPTVGALITFGWDMLAVLYLLEQGKAQPSSSPDPDTSGDTESGLDECSSEGGVTAPSIRPGGDVAPGQQPTSKKAAIQTRLVIEMRKLEVVMPYEGPELPPFVRGSMDGFSLQLELTADEMRLTTQLGNLVTVSELLPEASPYRTVCQLRPGGGEQGSLITVNLTSRTAAKHLVGARAPHEGILQVYHVCVELQAVQLVYLQCLLTQFTQYVYVMVSMGPPSRLPPPISTSQATPSPEKGAAPRPTVSPLSSVPFILVLDVKAGAPLIVMPHDKTSSSGLELDLGRLELHNSITWQPAETDGWRCLMDDLRLRLWGVGLVVVQPDGSRSLNCVQDLGEQGVVVNVTRALAVTPAQLAVEGKHRRSAPALPALQTHVDIAVLDLRCTDADYHTALAVLAGNYFEPLGLNRELEALQACIYKRQEELGAKLAAIVARVMGQAGEQPSTAGGGVALQEKRDSGDASSQQPPTPTSQGAAAEGHAGGGGGSTGSKQGRGWSHMIAGFRALLPGGHNFGMSPAQVLKAVSEKFSLGVTVLVRRASLQLFNHVAATHAAQGLAKLLVQDLWVSYSSSTDNCMFVKLSLPSVSVHDMRPDALSANTLVFSTSQVAATNKQMSPPGSLSPSLMYLEYRCLRGKTASRHLQALTNASGGIPATAASSPAVVSGVQVRLQKPTLVLDLAFLLPLITFVAPSAMLAGAAPTPWSSREVQLGREPHMAKGDLWLSPEVRLLADAPGITHFTYDGCGHSLVLPPCIHPADSVPLILVGAHRTLRLRNVKLCNTDSLAACLHLGPGASVIADERDGVVWVQGTVLPAGSQKVGNTQSPTKQPGSDSRHGSLEHSSHSTQPAAGAASAQPAASYAFEVQVEAYGASLHLLDSSSSSPAPGAGAPGSSSNVAGGVNTLSGASVNRPSGNKLLSAHRRLLQVPSPNASGDLNVMSAASASTSTRRLILGLDLSIAGRMMTKSQSWQLGLLGLTITSNTHQQSALPPPSPPGPLRRSAINSMSGSPAGASRPAQGTTSSSISSTVLSPCDLAITYSTSESASGGGGQVAGSTTTTLALDVTALSFSLTPDVLHIILGMQQSISKPLVVPSADQPLLRCDRFERIWCSAGPGGPPPSLSVSQGTLTVPCTGRGGVDTWAGTRGLALWRPQPPSGYLPLGDVAVGGAAAAPQFPVAVMAVNSGLVAWPLRYQVAWDAGEGLVLWKPVPPPGYVALGLVATVSGADPPHTQAVACLKQEAVVDARASQCVLLCAAGNLWSVANCGSTLAAAPPDVHAPPPGTLFDVRLPLGVAPAALTPLSALTAEPVLPTPATVTEPSHQEQDEAVKQAIMTRALQQRFLTSRGALARATSADTLTTTTVEFRRLWWDRHSTASPAGCQVSFWRPVPPPGYVALADCMVTGMYAPPQSALLVRDEPASASSLGQAPSSLSMLVRPLGYARVWQDEHRAKMGDSRYLSIWRPVPPAGYVAMGCVVGFGNTQPPTGIIRCVLSELVSSLPLNRMSPVWQQPVHKQRAPVLGWLLDERLASFIAMPQDEAQRLMTGSGFAGSLVTDSPSLVKTSRLEGYRLKLPLTRTTVDTRRDSSSMHIVQSPPRMLHVDVRAQCCSLLLKSASSQPLLEMGLQDIKAGLGTQEPGVLRGYLFSNLSLWSYAAGARAWEPLIEPWQILAHADINSSGSEAAGVAPGTWLKLTSTQSNVQASLTQGSIAALLLATQEWSQVLNSGVADREQADQALGVSSHVVVQVENQLGVEVEVAADTGTHVQEVFAIPPGTTQSILQPLPLPPPSPLTASLPPSRSACSVGLRLLVDVLGLEVLPGGGAPPAASDLHQLAGSPDAAALQDLQAQMQALWAQSGGKDVRNHGNQLACTVEVFGPLAELMPGSCWGCCTKVVPTSLSQLLTSRGSASRASSPPRAEPAISSGPGHRVVLPAPRSEAGDEEAVAWDDRFVLPLPAALTEQLLLGLREAGDQWVGVPLSLRFNLVDHDRPDEHILAAATAAVEYDWLANQVSTLKMLTGRGVPGSSGALTPSPSTLTSPRMMSAATAAAAASAHTEQLELCLPVQLLGGTSGQALEGGGQMQLVVAISVDTDQTDLVQSTKHVPPERGVAGGCSLVDTLLTGSASGDRALRLPPAPHWMPLPSTQAPGVSSLSTFARGKQSAGSSCIAFPLPSGEGAVLECSLSTGSVRREVLRSMAKLVNATDMPLEVSLVVGSDDAAWTVVPHTATLAQPGAGSAGASASQGPQVVEEEVFENECFVPLRGWSHTHLLSGERQRYNRGRTGGGDSNSFPQLSLPAAPEGQQGSWEWDGAWEVETTGPVDKDGWAYGSAWSMVQYPFAPGWGVRRPTDIVRRRRWVRRRVFRGRGGPGQGAGAGRRKRLGVVEPGASLALPLGWSAEGCDLQVRPLLNEPDAPEEPEQLPGGAPPPPPVDSPFASAAAASVEGSSAPSGQQHPLLLDLHGEALHAWSVRGVGSVGVTLSDLQDGAMHLLCCGIDSQAALTRLARSRSLGAGGRLASQSSGDSAQVMEAELAALLQPHWFSVTVECDPLIMTQGNAEVELDWRIIVRPPLLLHNSLPVPARFCVWERTGGAGGPLRARQQGQLGAWGSTPLYTADMRQQVCLSYSPEGCEFSESEPLLLVEGVKARPLAGAAGSPRLPDSFRCSYLHTQSSGAQLRLVVTRDVDLSAEAEPHLLPATAASSVTGSAGSQSGAFMGATGGVLAGAVAEGAPLVVRISAPLIVVNNTQLPVSVGVLGLEVRPDIAQDTASFSGATPAKRMASALPVGLDGTGPLRIIDTDAFTSAPRPTCHVTLLPRSLELLSLPPGCNFTSDTQPAVAICCQGSRWSAPLPLPTPPASLSAAATSGTTSTASPSLPSTPDPVLVRARCRAEGSVQDLVVRFEPGGMRNSLGAAGTGLASLYQVMHVETHLVLTNRTGYALQLVQPESLGAAAAAAASAPGTPLSAGAGAAGLQHHSPSLPPLRTASSPGNSVGTGTLFVPAGAVGLPIVWHPACTRKLLALGLYRPPGSESGAFEDGLPLTNPVSILQLPVGVEVQLLLPVARVRQSHPISTHQPFAASPHTPAASASYDFDDHIASSLAQPALDHSASAPNLHTSDAASTIPQSTFDQAIDKAAALLAVCSGPAGDVLGDPSSKARTTTAGPCWTRVYIQDGSDESGYGAQGRPAAVTEYVGVVVCVQLVSRAPGCLVLDLHSLGAEPSHLVHNSTPHPVAFHEHAPRCPWQVVRPLSAAGYVRRDLSGLTAQPALELEVAPPHGIGTGAGQVISFDNGSGDEAGGGAGPGSSMGSSSSPQGLPGQGGALMQSVATSVMVRLGERQADCVAQTSLLRELVLSMAGSHLTPGSVRASSTGMGGGAHADMVLRVTPCPARPGMAPDGSVQAGPLALGFLPAGGRSSSGAGWHCSVEVSGLELSLVDGRPQELLNVTLDGLLAEYHLGNTGGVDYYQLVLRVRNMQVDDQLPDTPHPVLLLPLDAGRHESTASSSDPLLYMCFVVEPGRRRDGVYYPSLTFRLLPLRVAVAEGTMWRLVACVDALNKLAGAVADAGPSGSRQPAQHAATGLAAHEQVQADMPLVLNFMYLEDVQLSMSFKPEPGARRTASRLISMSLDLVALEDLRLDLPGLHLERVRVNRDSLTQLVISRLQQRLLGMIFSILRNAGVLGSTSKILAVASQGMAQLTDTRLGGGSGGSREVGNLGEGMLEGGKALAKGVLAGAVGILAKPVEGAERAGVQGFFEGVTKGVAGVFVNPLSGVFAAAAKVTEGMDATYGYMRDAMIKAPRRSGRKRLPRAIRGDHVLVPYNLHASLGQSFMYASTHPDVATSVLTGGLNKQVLSRLASGSSSKSRRFTASTSRPLMQDCYEDHFTLPGNLVMLVTNKRLALLHAPEFVVLHQNVLSGETSHVTDVPGGVLQWWLTWDAMLTVDLTWHDQVPGPPDGVLVHRKERSPLDGKLLYDVRCRPGTSQAQEVMQVVSNTCRKYRLQSRADLAAAVPVLVTPQERATGQASPDWLLSLDWRLVWYSNAGARPLTSLVRTQSVSRALVSIWRPVGPAGYAMLGDVIVPGTEPPSRPVHMYRDGVAVCDARDEPPRLALPRGYSLVFRDSEHPVLTVWRPIPMAGYVEVGCVAWPATEEPPLNLVRCVRKDLVQASPLSDTPMWSGVSSDNQHWRATIWPVDSQCTTFVAVKGDAKPRAAYAPAY